MTFVDRIVELMNTDLNKDRQGWKTKSNEIR
jgi:hypothetical protein